jgi:hypothetical protein
VGLCPVPEPGVLPSAVRHDRDEPSAVSGDVAHRLLGAQLAVGDVEEVRPADQGVQFVPARDVRDVVGGVAVGDPVGDRHRTVSGDGEDEQQLLEVGPEVLVVALPDRRRRLPAAGSAVGVWIVAGDRDGGRVVVQLVGADAELAQHPQHGLGDQAGPVGVEQPVQRPADPVVVEQFGLAWREPEHRRVVARRPLTERVHRPVPGHDVAHQHGDHRSRGQPQPDIVGGQVGLQMPGQADAGQEEVDDRQAAQPLAAQHERRWRGHRGPP